MFFAAVAISAIFLFGFPSVYGPLEVPQLDDRNYEENSEAKAIPDWVKNQFEWFLTGEIDEETLLTSMNWMFDNNIMHLSPEAALEVKQLRDENQRYKELLGHELAHVTQQGGDSENTSQPGERIMQPEYGTSQSKVIVRGWDAQQKEVIEENQEAVARFIVELYADNISLSDEIWLPMKEGDVLVGFEDGDPDRPIIVGRIYNESSQGYKVGSILGMEKSSPLEGMEQISQTIENIYSAGGGISEWQEAFAILKNDASDATQSDLQKIVMLCNIEIDKKLNKLDAEMLILEDWIDAISEEHSDTSEDRLSSENQYIVQYRETDFAFITKRLASIDQELMIVDSGLSVLDEELENIGDDAQLENIDLQNKLQKQQQSLQTISNIIKAKHDAAMNSIRNMK